MKKILAIVLCLVLALSLAAVAETATTEKTEIGTLEVNGEFILKATLAEGYEIVPYYSDSLTSIWYIASEDETKPVMVLSIGFDEAYADVFRINDLTDEQLADLVATWTAEYDDAVVTFPETSHGTKLIQIVNIDDEDYTDFVDFFAIYEGYCIEFVLFANPEGGDSLTQEQIDACIDFLSDLDFEPIEG